MHKYSKLQKKCSNTDRDGIMLLINAMKRRENADMKSRKSRNGRNDRNGGCNTLNNEMNKGFSLIELLVVIAIMGIFIGTSFAFVGLIQAGNTNSVTKSIATGIQETRQKTMTQNLLYGWRFSVDTAADGSVSMTVTKQAAATQPPSPHIPAPRCTALNA